jgi:hypothetical protein
MPRSQRRRQFVGWSLHRMSRLEMNQQSLMSQSIRPYVLLRGARLCEWPCSVDEVPL